MILNKDDTVVGGRPPPCLQLDTPTKLPIPHNGRLFKNNLEQYIFYKSATSHCTCIPLYSLYSFVVYTQS